MYGMSFALPTVESAAGPPPLILPAVNGRGLPDRSSR